MKRKISKIIFTITGIFTIAVATKTFSVNEARMPFPNVDPSQAHNPFSFIVYGDIQDIYEDGHRKLVSQMKKQDVSLIMNTGDISPNDGKSLDGQFLSEIQDLAEKIPFFPAVGNHDVEFHSSSSRRPFQDFFKEAYDYLSDRPLNAHLVSGENNQRLWYAFRHATSLFVVLDSNLMIDSGRYRDTHSLPTYQGYAEQQFRWVQEVLEKSDQDPEIKSKFVFFHHSPFLSKENTSLFGLGGHEDDRRLMVNHAMLSTNGNGKDYLLDLFRRHSVTAVFSGHEHYYERWRETIDEGNGEIRDLNWIGVGSGGVKPRENLEHGDEDVAELLKKGGLYDTYLDRIKEIDPNWSAKLNRVFPNSDYASGEFQNYMIVHVDGKEIEFQTIDTKGNVRDSGFLSR